MQRRGLPFLEAQAKRIPISASIEEVKAWRTREAEAGRPSGLEDYCRVHGILLGPACKGEGLVPNENGMGSRLVGWDGEAPLFERCEVCGGTGRLQPR